MANFKIGDRVHEVVGAPEMEVAHIFGEKPKYSLEDQISEAARTLDPMSIRAKAKSREILNPDTYDKMYDIYTDCKPGYLLCEFWNADKKKKDAKIVLPESVKLV